MKDANNFPEFKERFNIDTNFLTFHGVVSCIKSLRKATEDQFENNRVFSSFVDNFLKENKPNRLAYNKLVNLKQSRPSKSQDKWCVDCNLQCSQETVDWKMTYKLSFCSTKVTKLITFQFKLLHRRLATNDFLNKIGLRENDICTFCRVEKESLIHLFWSCSETSCFWQGFKDWLAKNQIILKTNIFTPAIILGLSSDTLYHTKQYFYFLVARYFIWTCKTQETLPKIERFPGFLSAFSGFFNKQIKKNPIPRNKK